MDALPLLPYELVDAIVQKAGAADDMAAVALALTCRRIRALMAPVLERAPMARLCEYVPTLRAGAAMRELYALVRELRELDPQLVRRSCLVFESSYGRTNYMTVFLDMGGDKPVELSVVAGDTLHNYVRGWDLRGDEGTAWRLLRQRTTHYDRVVDRVRPVVDQLLVHLQSVAVVALDAPTWGQLIRVAWMHDRGFCRIAPIRSGQFVPFASEPPASPAGVMG